MDCPRCKSVLGAENLACPECGAPAPTLEYERTATVEQLADTETASPGLSPVADHSAVINQKQSFRGLLVHSVLGEGAMGAAYLASHPLLRMPLVIKTFKTAATSGVFTEAHLAARVTSPNVVGVIDAGVESGVPFVIQRYIDGIDLAELIRYGQEGGRFLPLNTICHILIDAANGLHNIHQAGVVHRDVKPANLFLNGDGSTTVGDFGIAVDASSLRPEQPISGTPVCMAPEQWLQEELGRYTDIYALGATSHLLLTGKPPFEASTMEQMAQAHLHEPYRPPQASTPAEAYLFSVVERTLRKRPEERYQTAEALARVLKVVAEPLPQIVATGAGAARIGPLQIELAAGDITRHAGDVMVNAANSDLVMDLGVAAALKRAAGPSVEEQAMRHAPVSMGEVVWTGAGDLRARWVAHAVSAMSGAVCLQRCALRVLLGAEVRRAGEVVFPALGTGVGEVPMDLAAKLLIEAMRTFASFAPKYVHTVRVVLFTEGALARWRTILQSM